MNRSPFAAMRRLHERGPRSRGLVVDRDGVTLGPDLALVRRTAGGYRCADADGLARLARAVFPGERRLERLPSALAQIARALGAGDLVKAQLLALEIPLAPLDDEQIERLAIIANLIKAGFDPDQPRDERGRWTSEGGSNSATGRPAGSSSESKRPSDAAATRPQVFGISANSPDDHDKFVPYDQLPGNAKKILQDRVLLPDGTLGIIAPEGYVRTPSDDGTGIVLREPGTGGNANTIRIMPPNEQYPDGRVIIYNGEGQPISPYSGRTGSKAQYHYHFQGMGLLPE